MPNENSVFHEKPHVKYMQYQQKQKSDQWAVFQNSFVSIDYAIYFYFSLQNFVSNHLN